VLMTQLFGYFTSAQAPFPFPGVSFFTAGLMLLGSLAICALVLERRIARVPAPPQGIPDAPGTPD